MATSLGGGGVSRVWVREEAPSSLQLLNPRLAGSRLLGSSCRPILEVTWRRGEWGGGVLIFISDPSFPFVFFFFSFGKNQSKQIPPCSSSSFSLWRKGRSTGAPMQAQRRSPKRWQVGQVQRIPSRGWRRGPSAQELRCSPAFPGPASLWNLGVFFRCLGFVSPRIIHQGA